MPRIGLPPRRQANHGRRSPIESPPTRGTEARAVRDANCVGLPPTSPCGVEVDAVSFGRDAILASALARPTGYRVPDHPVARSAEPGEDWAYCYVDRVHLDVIDADSVPTES